VCVWLSLVFCGCYAVLTCELPDGVSFVFCICLGDLIFFVYCLYFFHGCVF
jgi:hypothetical protein